ncbi:MAG: S9 family peptidase [Proteobacteria bacterium]|nr:S9 family peptidase [Pseudomonadota bacterium]
MTAARIAVVVLLLAGTAQAQSRPEAALFDPDAVVAGIAIDKRQCAAFERAETAVWVEGYCLRYYAAGLAQRANPIATLWLNGDILGPKGDNADKRQKGIGPATMTAQMESLSRRFGVPAIFLARPGTYGSAGKHHAMRGRKIEADLVAAVIDALKSRYGIREWALGGHSGGGTLVGEMLARRDDLRCAVISSGAVAYRAYLEARGLIKPGATLTRFDPYVSLDRVPKDPARRVFVIGDPRETNVPFATQKLYYDGLIARGHAATLIPLARTTDARHHDLVDFAETALGLCANGASGDVIAQALRALPNPPPRVTN